jgi:hypothetical protein
MSRHPLANRLPSPMAFLLENPMAFPLENPMAFLPASHMAKYALRLAEAAFSWLVCLLPSPLASGPTF